jgi:hypothetical protein
VRPYVASGIAGDVPAAQARLAPARFPPDAMGDALSRVLLMLDQSGRRARPFVRCAKPFRGGAVGAQNMSCSTPMSRSASALPSR